MMERQLERGNVEYALNEFQNQRNNHQDYIYILKHLQDTLRFLSNHLITYVPSFTTIMKRFSLLTNDINECIFSFVVSYNINNPNQTINWFNNRSFKHCNRSHKDFIIARLIYEHEQTFLLHLRNYVANTLSNETIDQFISEMQSGANEIRNQT